MCDEKNVRDHRRRREGTTDGSKMRENTSGYMWLTCFYLPVVSFVEIMFTVFTSVGVQILVVFW
jgi:hypothetical protein